MKKILNEFKGNSFTDKSGTWEIDWIYSNPKDKYFVYYPVGNTDPIR